MLVGALAAFSLVFAALSNVTDLVSTISYTPITPLDDIFANATGVVRHDDYLFLRAIFNRQTPG